MSACIECKQIKSDCINDSDFICEDCDVYECDCCQEKIVDFGQDKRANRGSCSDGNCKHEPPVESLCGQCGTWDEDDQVWRCPDCQEEHEPKWEEVYNSTDIMKGVAREYCGQPGKFYQTYGNGGGKNGSGGYWIRDGSAGVWSVAGETFTYLKDATVEYRNQRSMAGICAAIRVDVNPPEPDGDCSDDE